VKVAAERGATIVELLVTAALVIVAVLVAASLIMQSARLNRSVLEGLSRPDGELAMAWVRRDVHASVALLDPGFGWSEGPLRLAQFGGAEVVYSWRDGVLMRAELDAEGEEVGRRTVMRRLDGWRWRALATRLVEVELRPQWRAGSRRVRSGDRGEELPMTERELCRSLMALRDRGARRW
jgi:hypothetical protein